MQRAVDFLLDICSFYVLFCGLISARGKSDLEMERALETQRVKLLRLLAGWVAVVEIVSMGPLQIELPHWMRSFLASLLTRAEFATQNLVFVSACLAVKRGSRDSMRPGPTVPPVSSQRDESDAVPSTKALLHRMQVLRALLRDLPRHGFRLTRRAARKAPTAKGFRSVRDGLRASASWGLSEEIAAPGRVARPPDKSLAMIRLGRSRSLSSDAGWEARVVRRANGVRRERRRATCRAVNCAA